MILYLENSKTLQKQLLELLSEISAKQDTKSVLKKTNLYFHILSTNNLKIKLRKNLINSSIKKNKSLRNKLKKVELYTLKL